MYACTCTQTRITKGRNEWKEREKKEERNEIKREDGRKTSRVKCRLMVEKGGKQEEGEYLREKEERREMAGKRERGRGNIEGTHTFACGLYLTCSLTLAAPPTRKPTTPTGSQFLAR